MKLETIDKIRELVQTRDYDNEVLTQILVKYEKLPNERRTHILAYKLEDLITKFNNRCQVKETQFEYFQYHRWQRISRLIMLKASKGLLVTQAERIQCCSSLMLAEVYTY